jgi:hypothetical protein
MTPYQTKLKAILDGLYTKTASGSLEWTAGEGSVSTKLNSGTVTLRQGMDADGQDAILFKLAGDDGKTKLAFDDTALSYRAQSGSIISYYTYMNDLLEMALRSATGEDRAVNDLLEELGPGDDVPF